MLFLRYCNNTHTATSGRTKERVQKELPELFQNHILCAGTLIGSQGSCKGDSGGPLNTFDVEISSWVVIATVQGGIRDCGDTDFPGLYILLDDPTILNFIFSTIGRKAVPTEPIEVPDPSKNLNGNSLLSYCFLILRFCRTPCELKIV